MLFGGSPTAHLRFDSCESQFDTYLRVFDVGLTNEFVACDDCGPCGLQVTQLTGLQQLVAIAIGGTAFRAGRLQLNFSISSLLQWLASACHCRPLQIAHSCSSIAADGARCVSCSGLVRTGNRGVLEQ